MTTITIPEPLFTIETEYDWVLDNEITDQPIKITLCFGGYKVVDQVYTISRCDYDDYELDNKKEHFYAYVAKHLAKLFEES